MKFNGKTVLVIGGTSGIGKTTAQRFMAAGAFVIVTGRRSVEDMTTIKMDVQDVNSTKAVIDDLANKYGNFDCVFINAGVFYRDSNRCVTEEQWDTMFDTNTKGAYFAAHHCYPHMNKNGSIIFTSSIAGSLPDSHGVFSAYGASKAALNYVSKALSKQFARRHVRVNSVSPGPTDITPGAVRDASRMDRMSHPDDIADAVLFLASDNAMHITGIDIVVDGGRWHNYKV